jgi:hypothetical protein
VLGSAGWMSQSIAPGAGVLNGFWSLSVGARLCYPRRPVEAWPRTVWDWRMPNPRISHAGSDGPRAKM